MKAFVRASPRTPPGRCFGPAREPVPWTPIRGRVANGYWFLFLAVLPTGCAHGPDYQVPNVELPATFKEGPGWKVAQPRELLARSPWWKIFNDAVLDRLEDRLALNNQSLRAAEAQYRVAVAQAEAAGASLFPTLTSNLGVTRSKASNAKSTGTTPHLGLNASWELDLWGRVNRLVEGGEASIQAGMDDLEGARLSLQTQMAQNYFLLRVAEEQQRLYRETLAAYEKSLVLTQHQHAAGVATTSDVAQAESLLRSTQAQALDTDLQRTQLEHLLAQLTGHVPTNFSLEPATLTQELPDIPPTLPAELLERRPDVAAAERRVAVANAQVGVAAAAFFPTFSLNMSGGYQGNGWSSWFDAPAHVWSLGPTLAATLFDGGLRQTQHRQALAAYDQAVAHYRQSVLNAVQEVEDNLAALRSLNEQSVAQTKAVQAARQAQTLTENQYRAGVVGYPAMVTTQTATLTSERAALTMRGRRYTAIVTLIKALGGLWQEQP
ncbi:MAG: efflux transporter outer membrane subunit [Magnetococcales bacterium]|nr:efflux transporter outer membrane subunit [Magnetococcales bacterium]